MPFDDAPNVMANWPYSWRLGQLELEKVLNRLASEGYRVWPNGQLLVPSPFGLGCLNCRLEVWQPGIVFRFTDGYRGVIVPYQVGHEPSQVLGWLVANSHPLRFSPYRFWGGVEGLFIGRKVEMSLLLSAVPGIVVVGGEGSGKTNLFCKAARQRGTRVICCQPFGFHDLVNYLQELERCGAMPQSLFLDEMDALLQDARTRRLLRNLEEKGLAWRVAVHQARPDLGLNLQLSALGGMNELLKPLAAISGKELPTEGEITLLRAAQGNPRRLQYLCHQLLQSMGELPLPITLAMVHRVVAQTQRESVANTITATSWAKVG